MSKLSLEVIPAILTKSRKELIQKIKLVEPYVKTIQIDIIDGKFVKNKTVQPKDFRGIKSKAALELHLMVKNPAKYMKAFNKYAKRFIFHREVTRNPEKFIGLARKLRKQVGIAINPGTPIRRIVPFLGMVDQVLIMTVHPGWTGQKFVTEALEKVKELRKINKKINIEVDGGIHLGTAGLAAKAGANKFVAASAIYDHLFIKNAIEAIKEDAYEGFRFKV